MLCHARVCGLLLHIRGVGEKLWFAEPRATVRTEWISYDVAEVSLIGRESLPDATLAAAVCAQFEIFGMAGVDDR